MRDEEEARGGGESIPMVGVCPGDAGGRLEGRSRSRQELQNSNFRRSNGLALSLLLLVRSRRRRQSRWFPLQRVSRLARAATALQVLLQSVCTHADCPARRCHDHPRPKLTFRSFASLAHATPACIQSEATLPAMPVLEYAPPPAPTSPRSSRAPLSPSASTNIAQPARTASLDKLAQGGEEDVSMEIALSQETNRRLSLRGGGGGPSSEDGLNGVSGPADEAGEMGHADQEEEKDELADEDDTASRTSGRSTSEDLAPLHGASCCSCSFCRSS